MKTAASKFEHNGFTSRHIARRWVSSKLCGELAEEIDAFAEAYGKFKMSAKGCPLCESLYKIHLLETQALADKLEYDDLREELDLLQESTKY